MFQYAVILVVILVAIAALYFLYKKFTTIPTEHPQSYEDTATRLEQASQQDEDVPQVQEPDLMVPILPQYNRVLEGTISEADKERLLNMKRAADAVYLYYEWVANDFRRVDDTKEHSAQIEALLQDVMACLGLSQFQKSLAGYFVVCVLSEIKEEFMAGGPNNTMFPINIEGLQETIFNVEDIIDGVHGKPNYYPFYLAGIFVPEDYDSDDLDMMTKAAIIRGAIVYSDDILTTTDSLMDIVEAYTGKPYSEATEDQHFEAFMYAIKQLYTVNHEYNISSLIEKTE